jgi:hypothetical protein
MQRAFGLRCCVHIKSVCEFRTPRLVSLLFSPRPVFPLCMSFRSHSGLFLLGMAVSTAFGRLPRAPAAHSTTNCRFSMITERLVTRLLRHHRGRLRSVRLDRLVAIPPVCRRLRCPIPSQFHNLPSSGHQV